LLTLFTSASSLYADYPNSVIDSNPVGYWRLNDRNSRIAENSGTAGEAMQGKLINVQPGAASVSELGDGTPVLGMGFNNVAVDVGENAYIDFEAPLLNGLNSFTMSGWFWPRELTTAPTGLLGQNGVIEIGFIDGEMLTVETGQGGSVNWNFEPESGIREEAWFHLAVVGTGSSLRVYLNGENVATGGTPVGTSYGTSASPFRIGGSGILSPGDSGFRGTVDDIALWDRALTENELAVQFQQALAANAPGDFNFNGTIDVGDVNLLLEAIYEESVDANFDVSNDGVVNDDDLAFWVEDIALTWFGDANFDGEFSSRDFVLVFQRGQYEDQIPLNSRWDDGDWNADLEFNSSDFVTAFQGGGFEVGPTSVAIAAVPEPATWTYLLVAIGAFTGFMRRTMLRAA
jgi:hypothetical protein